MGFSLKKTIRSTGYIFNEAFVKSFPQHPVAKRNLFLKQGLYATAGILSGEYLLMAVTNFVGYCGSLVKRPSKVELDDLVSYYDIQEPLKKEPFNLKLAVALGAFTGAALYQPLSHPDFLNVVTLADYAKLSLFGFTFYEAITGAYKTLQRSYVYQSSKDFTLSKDLERLFFTSSKQTNISKVAEVLDGLQKNSKHALAKTVELYYGENKKPSTFSKQVPESYVLNYFYKDAVGAFVNSLIGIPMEKFKENFFNKSLEKATHEKDLTLLGLLAIYRYKEHNSLDLFTQYADLLLENNQLHRSALDTGTISTVRVLGEPVDESISKEKNISLAMVEKASFQTNKLEEKFHFNKQFEGSTLVNPILAYEKRNSLGVLLEPQILKPTLEEALSQDHSLYQLAYDHFSLYHELFAQKNILLEKLNLVDKYLENPLFTDHSYYRFVEDSQRFFEELDDYRPLLDFHTKNLFVDGKQLIHVDLENKGRGPMILDFVKLFHYTPHIVDKRAFTYYHNTLLDDHNEKLGLDEYASQKSFLLALEFAQQSHVLARLRDFTFEARQESKMVIKHISSIFEDYARHIPSQKQLATQQLERSELLLKSI